MLILILNYILVIRKAKKEKRFMILKSRYIALLFVISIACDSSTENTVPEDVIESITSNRALFLPTHILLKKQTVHSAKLLKSLNRER